MPTLPMFRPEGQTIAELLMRQGDIAGRAALARGAAWGNAISGIGEAAAGAYTQYKQQKDQQKREDMLSAAMASFNPENPMEFYRRTAVAVGPEAAMRVTSGMASLMKMQTEAQPDPKDAATVLSGVAAMIEKAPGAVAQNWPAIRQAVGKYAPMFGLPVPEEYTPEVGQQIVALNAGLNPTKAGGTRQVEVTNPDGSKTVRIVEDRPGQEFSSAAPPAKPENLTGEEAYILSRFGAKPTPAQLLQGRREYSEAGREPETPGKPQLTATSESNVINRLSNQWTAATKTSRELRRQVDLMDRGLEAARRGDLTAGSQAVLVTFQKILDPNSVVRESEYARSAAGQALLARIEGAVEQIQKGGAGVPVRELEKFAKLAREMTSNSTDYLKGVRERIGKTADRYGIPRELVLEEMPTEPSGSAPKQIRGIEDYNALPAGTVYIDPKGVRRQKK